MQIDIEYYKRYQKRLDMTYFIRDSFINKEQLSGELRYLRFLLTQIYSEYSSKEGNESRLESLTRELLGFLTEQFQYYTYSKSQENSYDIVRRQEMKAEHPYYNRIYDIIDPYSINSEVIEILNSVIMIKCCSSFGVLPERNPQLEESSNSNDVTG